MARLLAEAPELPLWLALVGMVVWFGLGLLVAVALGRAASREPPAPGDRGRD